MTVKRKSLLELGIAKQEAASLPELLKGSNLDKSKLLQMVRSVANHVGLPADRPFAKDSHGNDDVSIFDFSQKKQAELPFKKPGPLVLLVGDSLKEPFWPLGTGANRAILAALDAAWTVKRYYSEPNLPFEKLLEAQRKFYQILSISSPNDVHDNYGLHTIDPRTRYKGMTHTKFA
eukprot:TRINITY_DN1024_c0_g1_i6.p1 TRINITY_DN1024_c0_g1~~TRINITY_DN1024_c0_g1_i6.p1  ORF type:complete len:176 (-),score=43.38 TRINITY_DN1024_c0_g1_i6:73-600(-)